MVLEKNVKNTMDRITKAVVFQRAKEERLLLKILKNKRHSWIGYTIRHNEFVVNILEGYVEIKCQLDATEVFICRSYCLLATFRMWVKPAGT